MNYNWKIAGNLFILQFFFRLEIPKYRNYIPTWKGSQIDLSFLRSTDLRSRYSTDLSVVESYLREHTFISLVRRIERSRWKVVRDGNALTVFALSASVYLRSDSQPIVGRCWKGNRRRYSCLAACCLHTVPCRCGWQSTFPNCTPQPRNILTVFSRSFRSFA